MAHTDAPQDMAPGKIFEEVAALLAAGFLRLQRECQPSSNASEERHIPQDSVEKESSEFAHNRLDTHAN